MISGKYVEAREKRGDHNIRLEYLLLDINCPPALSEYHTLLSEPWRREIS